MNNELKEKLKEGFDNLIYEEYCKRHPEEITSDFILEEDGNEDYIDEIVEENK